MVFTSASAQIRFVKHSSPNTVDVNGSIVAVDLDSDEDIDVITSHFYADTGSITWWENDGNQNFTTQPVEDSLGYNNILAEDFDNDDDIDMIVASYHSGDIAWFENDGNQIFTSHPIANTFSTVRGIHVTDFNDDGHFDIVAVKSSEPDCFRWWNGLNNRNSLGHLLRGINSGGISVSAADIDDDGFEEIIGRTYGGLVVWWDLEGDYHTIVESTPWGINAVFPTDFDSDGDIDLLTSPTTHDGIAWYENTGNGNFEENVIWNSGYINVYYNIPADMDSDGDKDILVSTELADIIWWKNNGDLGFERNTISGYTFLRDKSSLIDIDSDDDLDVVCADWDGGFVWLENIPNPEVDNSFSLIEPDEDLIYGLDPAYQFVWESSNDAAEYDLHFDLTFYNQGNFIDTVLVFTGINDTSLYIDFIDHFPGFDPDMYFIDATWRVEAISDEYTTFCRAPFALNAENWWDIDQKNIFTQANNFKIISAYPNPFNSNIKIQFELPFSSHLNISVYNYLGQKVAQLTSGRFNAGYHDVVFEASNFSSGIYFINASVPGKMNEIKKVVLLK